MALGIYIHIPFCVAKCKYCDFLSFSSNEENKDAYVQALCKEIRAFDRADDMVDTIYFGGGTPTVLKAEQLVHILDAVKDRFKIDENCEITTECNPATMDFEGFRILKEAGFNRISMGLQSANNQELKLLGRIHTFEQCEKTFNEARKAGFSNISLDLMFALPYQTMDLWKNSLNAVVKLSPEHISCYGLIIEEGTPFYDMEFEPDGDLSRDMYDFGTQFLEDKGYNLYEISNFSKKGFESRHNMKYWKCDDYAGFGLGSSSFVNNVRYSNTRDMAEYLKKDDKVEESLSESEFETMSEFVFLGLRMTEGVSKTEFEKRFKKSLYDVFKKALDKNIKRGTIALKGDRYIIPREYLYVSNDILIDFV